MKRILLTFDVEEFDLPREFNQNISEEEMYEISKNGLFAVINLLDKHSIKATFFTTSNFAKKYPKIIKDLSKQGHEIACHGYSHSDDYLNSLSNIKIAKQEIEKIIKSKINGFRAPRFKIKNILGLSEFGFIYDSSLHPTWIPGRYMNLFKKRKIHKIEDITEIPLSTLPILRLPIFWLAFKNF
ncbi:MAG TPA: polysaccharide deacetylase, partial [Candidatus Pacearchaeota archaeon]|nr:polysaccharide deacetylase [Candidatus Pacearchaeota archaeon]